MALTPGHAEQEVLAETLRRDGSSMTSRQLFAAIAPGVLFGILQTALLVRGGVAGFDLWPVLACLLVLVAAEYVRIDLPFGYTVPVQLVIVPLWFVAPVALVPLLVMLAIGVHDLIDVLRGRLRASRLVTVPANAAYMIAPATIFVVAGVQPRSAGPVLLLVALAAQFAMDFVLATLRQTMERAVSITSQLGENWIYLVDAGLTALGYVVAKQAEQSSLAVLALLPLLAIFRVFSKERRARLESLLELRDAYRGTALVLRDVVEADDGYTGRHCHSVVMLALAVGEELGLEAQRMRNLEFGALLHDVGKIAIPKEIINKPGKLDPREWLLVKTHTLEGQRMLDRVGGSMRDVGVIVRSHHERWDGHGYPDGLAGEEIPLESRIISCCDTWNAMRTDRSYRRALSYEAAMAELIAASSTQLDPAIVSALVAVLEREERNALPPRSTKVGALAAPTAPPRAAAPAAEALASLDAAAAAG
jgi:HD-GYP domain-containing protein (c-di-GMP phosphodiesterase class II)